MTERVSSEDQWNNMSQTIVLEAAEHIDVLTQTLNDMSRGNELKR